jgi:replicative DNA helicase
MSHDDILRRVPPQNLEAEQSVLGAVFIPVRVEDNDIVAAQARILSEITAIIGAEDFYGESHREIFRAMLDLASPKNPIDAITMTDILRARGALEMIGGAAYLAELVDSVPTAANVAYYARIVGEKAVLRSVASVTTEIASLAYDSPHDIREFLGSAESMFLGAVRQALGDPEPRLIDAMRDLLVTVERGDLAGVPTGFPALDQFLASGGFGRGTLNTLAATTSVGKSAFACNVAIRVPRAGVLILSSEMTRDEILRRLIADLGNVDWSKISRRRPAIPNDLECRQITVAMERLSTMPLEVRYRRRLTPADVRREALLVRADFDGKLDLLIVDYLQLMDSDTPQKRRDLEIAQITKELKNIAGELDVPILLLSQLNREAAKGESGEPELWHLRESGAIEQDSDTVILLWEPRDQRSDPLGDLIVNWKIAKQRNGPKVRLPAVLFERQFTRFGPSEG